MSLSYSFAGKRVLITGGALGIGRQLVQRFHDGGAEVFTVDKNAKMIAKLKEELPGVTAVVLDLTDWAATKKTVESFGGMDHLVNNAGIAVCHDFLDITEESSNLLHQVHVQATINVSQVVAKGMIQRGTGGTIVNFSSMGVNKTMRTAGNYSAVKSAVRTLTKSMALELGPHNIRVNCVLPGFVETTMIRGPDVSDDLIDAAVQALVIKRTITPDEIADTVLFLLSPLSSMIVGQGVIVDGGWDLS